MALRHLAPLLFAAVALGQESPAPEVLIFPDANSRPNYFTVHNIREAHAVSNGKGVKVGIMDHSFGTTLHQALYAGGRNFQGDTEEDSFLRHESHGYWMALALREIAPEADIYALGTSAPDEARKVDAMIKAIDWAVGNGIQVLTYSDRKFSPANRGRLDEAVERAQRHGIVTTFIHYPHPGNLLPGYLRQDSDDERDPDVNIYPYDYRVLLVRMYMDHIAGRPHQGWRPFLSVSSMSPVAAGVVALMRSIDPKITPEECKRILIETSRPMEYSGIKPPHVMDAAAAVRQVRDRVAGSKRN